MRKTRSRDSIARVPIAGRAALASPLRGTREKRRAVPRSVSTRSATAQRAPPGRWLYWVFAPFIGASIFLARLIRRPSTLFFIRRHSGDSMATGLEWDVICTLAPTFSLFPRTGRAGTRVGRRRGEL